MSKNTFHWHYQLVRKDGELAIYEVFVDEKEDGTDGISWADEPATFSAGDPEDDEVGNVVDQLRLAIKDIRKYPILVVNDDGSWELETPLQKI